MEQYNRWNEPFQVMHLDSVAWLEEEIKGFRNVIEAKRARVEELESKEERSAEENFNIGSCKRSIERYEAEIVKYKERIAKLRAGQIRQTVTVSPQVREQRTKQAV